MEDNIHSGHRERLRERFDDNGLRAFSDVEALELLLFYALPRCNTNELAHRLLERFGGFREVMEADASELALVKGVGENAARLIRLVSQLNMRYLRAGRVGKRGILGCTEDTLSTPNLRRSDCRSVCEISSPSGTDGDRRGRRGRDMRRLG